MRDDFIWWGSGGNYYLKAIDGHILAAGELVGERQGELSRREH